MKKILFALILLLAFACSAFAQTYCTISGTVRDGRGNAVARSRIVIVKVVKSGALISSAPITIYSGTDGTFSFDLPRSSTAYIYAEIVGFNRNPQQGTPVAIPSASTADLSTLVPETNVPGTVPVVVPGSSGVWGGITGTLSAQTDLQSALDAKQAADNDLTTYAGITPSANVQTLLGAANYAAFKTSLSLNNVENTALSTWAGTTNITTLGTIGAGIWQGTAIGDSYISSAATWNAKISASSTDTLTNKTISGASNTLSNIGNSSLTNSAITICGASTSLGSSVTATTCLDSIGSTRGSILYRGASGWAILSPGTSGYVLTSNGSGADPTYQAASGGVTANPTTGTIPYLSAAGVFSDSPITRTSSTAVSVAGTLSISNGSSSYLYGDTTTPKLLLSNAVGTELSYGSNVLGIGGPNLTFSVSGTEKFRIGTSEGFKQFNAGTVGWSSTSASTGTIDTGILRVTAGQVGITDGGVSNFRDLKLRSVESTGYAFASLPSATNGTLLYCSDCTIANPCAGSGTGAFAKRLNGVWVCN